VQEEPPEEGMIDRLFSCDDRSMVASREAAACYAPSTWMNEM
jgi:hypothetical protein